MNITFSDPKTFVPTTLAEANSVIEALKLELGISESTIERLNTQCSPDVVAMEHLRASKSANDVLAIELARAKEEIEYLKGRRVHADNVVKSVWAQHEQQFAEQMAENEKLKREIESLKYTSETLKLKLAEIAQRDICGTERWTERM